MVPPFERAYWPIPARLLAGCFPGHQDAVKMDERLAPLVQAGVTLTINLMEPDERNREGLLFTDYAERLRVLGRSGGRFS